MLVETPETNKQLRTEDVHRIVNLCVVVGPLLEPNFVRWPTEIADLQVQFGNACMQKAFEVAEQVHAFGQRATDQCNSFIRLE